MVKDIREIDVNMKENISDDLRTSKYYNLDNEYLLGSAFHNHFERLDQNDFVSEAVENLKRHPAGENIIFETNSSFINIKATLLGGAYMSHMTSVATIGFALYVKCAKKWKYLSCTKVNSKEYNSQILKDCDKKMHKYRLYFPLYQALTSAFIGVEETAKFRFIKEDMDTMVIYGTSISQGGCATRPGMDYGAILGRMKDLNVINLGFSGSCKLEDAMVDIINRIDKKYLIIEAEANSPAPSILKERLNNLINKLQGKDQFKIYLISHFDEAMGEVNSKYKKLRKEFYNVQKAIKGVNFIDGTKLIKNIYCEGSVDGVHLTDLGFYYVAKGLKKIIF